MLFGALYNAVVSTPFCTSKSAHNIHLGRDPKYTDAVSARCVVSYVYALNKNAFEAIEVCGFPRWGVDGQFAFRLGHLSGEANRRVPSRLLVIGCKAVCSN